MSVPVLSGQERVPTFRIKRQIEAGIRESGLPHTIFRGSLFMDDWFALMGSSIPLRGAEAHTLARPFWFSKVFRKATGHAIERHGVALVPGSGRTRHAFVALDDVADFLAAAAASQDSASETWDIGGPEVLSWNDAVALFARVLGRPVRALRTPAAVYRALAALLGPLSPPAVEPDGDELDHGARGHPLRHARGGAPLRRPAHERRGVPAAEVGAFRGLSRLTPPKSRRLSLGIRLCAFQRRVRCISGSSIWVASRRRPT